MADKKAKIATDPELAAAIKRVRSERDDTPVAIAVKYIASYDILIVELNDNSRVVLQRESLQGLQNATKSQLGTSRFWAGALACAGRTSTLLCISQH